MSARAARLVLVALAGILVAGLIQVPDERGAPGQRGDGADQSLHTQTIARLRGGESYYVAVGDELRRRGFPTASVLNWRTPVLFSALSVQPDLGRVAFVVFALLVLAHTVRLLSRQPVAVVLGGAIAQSGAIGVMFDSQVWVFHEIWAGYLLALSAFVYALRHWTLGAVLGLLALFVRELAAPFVVICACLAWRAGRRRELGVWIAGLCLYAVHYGWHFRQVLAHQQPGDVAHPASWLHFGGVPFILTTLRTNSLLHNASTWLAAVFFVILIAGLLTRALPSHLRAAVVVYVACFALAGQPFNWYWGWLPGFVIPVVFAHGLLELPSLVSTAANLRHVRTDPQGLRGTHSGDAAP